MKKIILKIDGMTCSACSSGLEKYLLKQDGVEDALVNLVMATASITYDENISIDDLNRFVSEAGFKSMGEYNILDDKEDNKNISMIINGITVLLVLYISMSHMIKLPVIAFLHMKNHPVNYAVCLFAFSIYFLYFGRDIIINGIKNIKYKSPNMDSLVMIGVLSSFIYSFINLIFIIKGNNSLVESLYFESICMILYLVKLGRYIDGKSKEKTKDAIKCLVTITPKSALIKRDDGELEISIDEVKKGDILIVKPGMKFAVDGVIVKGSCHIDESFITGESIPVKKSVNDNVVAGSINANGIIEYKAINIGRDSTISHIVRLVVEATNTKAPIARVADRVSSIFVPLIILIAFASLIIHLIIGSGINNSLISFVTVLVCACPCALGLATSLAIVVSEGVCARNGLLVKRSDILENASKIDTVVFDKTGTLTYGKLNISRIYNYSKMSDDEILKIVGSIESLSSHPIAYVFANYLTSNNIDKLDVSDFKSISGMGLSGNVGNDKYLIGNNKLLKKFNIKNDFVGIEDKLSSDGNSIVYIIKNEKIIALIGVRDIVRDNAISVVKKLKKLNKKVIMLTGDNETTATIIAKSIGIDEVIANVSPSDKADKIKSLIDGGDSVMMVGDGINDAPSLSFADIGVSFNSGTDIAGDSANVILMKNDLNEIYNLFDISHKTLKNIKQNLFWAFFYNVCMVPIAAGVFEFAGLKMNPMIASISMTLSSTTVIINALRLRKWKEK